MRLEFYSFKEIEITHLKDIFPDTSKFADIFTALMKNPMVLGTKYFCLIDTDKVRL